MDKGKNSEKTKWFEGREIYIVSLFVISLLVTQYFMNLNFVTAFIFLFVNIGLIGVFGNFLVDSAGKLAKSVNIKGFLIGLVLLPSIASLPEILVSVMSNIQEPSIGNVMLAQTLGNNLFELLIVFGIVGFLACSYDKCMTIKKKSQQTLVIRNGVMLFMGSILLMILMLIDRNLTFPEGLVLIFYYLIFIILLFFSKRLGIEEEYGDEIEELREPKQVLITFLKTIGFLIIIVLLSDMFVSDLLLIFKSSPAFEKFSFLIIGITVAIPDLVLSIVGMIQEKREPDNSSKGGIILGFVIGGAIWDLIISIGVQGIVNPIEYISNPVTIFLLIVTFVAILVSVTYIRSGFRFTKLESLSLLALYIVIFIVVLVLV